MAYRDDLEAAQQRTQAAEAEAERLRSALEAERKDRTVARTEVAADRIFVGVTGHVLALSRDGGAELWRTKLSSGYPALVVVEWPDVYAACHGELHRLAPGTGDIMWKNKMKGLGYQPMTIAPVPRGLSGGNRVYVGMSGVVLALDKNTGKEVWRTEIATGAFLNVVLLGEEVLVGGAKGLICLDARTGEERWRNELPKLIAMLTVVTIGPASVGQIATPMTAADVTMQMGGL